MGRGSQFLQKKSNIIKNCSILYTLPWCIQVTEQPLVITHVEIPTVTENPGDNLLEVRGPPREKDSPGQIIWQVSPPKTNHPPILG